MVKLTVKIATVPLLQAQMEYKNGTKGEPSRPFQFVFEGKFYVMLTYKRLSAIQLTGITVVLMLIPNS